MEIQVDIAFDQLLRIVKSLPEKQLKLLKAEIEVEDETNNDSGRSISPIAIMKENIVKPENNYKKKDTAKSTGNFDEVFGLWKGKNISLDKIRNQQWGKRIK